MSFFTNFPKLGYDINQNGDITAITDIFRYVDVIEKLTNNPMAYQYEYIRDGERPDNLSLRLYNSVDYYWSFFIANDFLKDGLKKWPKGQYELQQYISNAYADYGVLSVPAQAENNLIGLLDESDNPISLNDVDAYVVSGAYAHKVLEYDVNRAQLFLDTSKVYANSMVDNNDLIVHFLLGENSLNDSEESDAAPDSPNPRVYVSVANDAAPTWDSNVGAYYFNGTTNYLGIDPSVFSFHNSIFTDTITGSDGLILHDNENWTISFHYKGDMGSGLSSESEGENGTIAGSSNTTSASNTGAGFGIVDGQFAYWIMISDNNPSTYSTSNRNIVMQSTTKINDNEWHYCTLTNAYDSVTDTHVTKMYVDGILEDSTELNQEYYQIQNRQYHIGLNYLMVGDIPYDSDDSTSDEPKGINAYTRGYLKDFRVYSTAKLPYQFTLIEDEVTDIFSWDLEANPYKTFDIVYSNVTVPFDAYYYWADASLAPDYYIDDSDETITTYDALDAESDLRSQQFVSYKESLENENEESRTISVVKPQYIQKFAEEYKRLMNL